MTILSGKRFFILLISSVVALQAYSQTNWQLNVYVDSLAKEQLQLATMDKINAYLNEYHSNMVSKGYAAASLDSVWTHGDTLEAYFYKGQQYFFGNIDFRLDKDVLHDINVKEKFFTLRKANFSALEALPPKIVTYYENNGYPFAKVLFKDITLQKDTFFAALAVEKGPLVIIDSVNNELKSKVSIKLLRSYIGISPGDIYREDLLRKVDTRLRKLPYVTVQNPTRVLFNEKNAEIDLFVNRKKVNQIDFIIGVLPKNSITGKIVVTGEARIHLWNAFGRGEKIFIDWKKLERSSQNLQLLFEYPYLLGTSLGVYGDFALRKRDTTHLDLAWNFGIPYQFSGNDYVKLFFKNFQTIVLKPDTSFASRNLKLPGLLDVSSFTYGGEWYMERLDDLFNPQDGWEAHLSVGVGTRKIKRNNAFSKIDSPFFPNYNFDNLYDSIDLKTFKTEIGWDFSHYWRFAPRHVLKTGIQGKGLFNENILENELYRIGGAKILRGFDEEAIRTSFYQLTSLEYRFLLQQTSYFYLFSDIALIKMYQPQQIKWDVPIGFGAGLAFGTKVGIFGVSYALGWQRNIQLDFRTAKIHFGYVTNF
ncbi:MAG: BamA/TamA family outer membrane protein [Chitinophagales bacterium]|nr:BamA/TamA family outer membrane protein [Chitinophagales bacterium]